MEQSNQIELVDPTPSNTNILSKPGVDGLKSSGDGLKSSGDGLKMSGDGPDFLKTHDVGTSIQKGTNGDEAKDYIAGRSTKKALKRRILKGTILQWIFGLIAYGIASAIFIPIYLQNTNIWADKEPKVEETAAVLKGRFADVVGKNDSELAAAFASNLGMVFVNGAYQNTSSDVMEQQTTQALGMLSASLPVETAMTKLVPLAAIAKLTANGNQSLALLRVSGAISSTVGNSTEFLDRIRYAMAGLASYTTDRDAAALLVPKALGGAMYQALETPAMTVVDTVSASFFEVATENYLDEMFTWTWIALLITEVVVIILALLVLWCRREPEILMYNDYFKIHWFVAGMLLAPVGVFYAAIPTFQITYTYSTIRNLYVFAACLTTLEAVFGVISPIIWLVRSWYKDCNMSKQSWQNNYFVMAPWHFLLVLFICSFHVWCFYDEVCTIAINYIPICITVGVIGVEFAFYAIWVLMKERRQDYYAGFWPANRMLIFFFCLFVTLYAFTATKDSKMLTSQTIVAHLNIVVFGATIDFFLLPVIQAIGRKYRDGVPTFSNCDIATLPTKNLQTPLQHHNDEPVEI